MPFSIRHLCALLACGLASGCASTASYTPETDPVAQWLASDHPQALPAYLASRENDQEPSARWKTLFTACATLVAYHYPVMGLSSSASAFLTMTSGSALINEEKDSTKTQDESWLAMMMSLQNGQHLQARVHELEARLNEALVTAQASAQHYLQDGEEHLNQSIENSALFSLIPAGKHLQLTGSMIERANGHLDALPLVISDEEIGLSGYINSYLW